MRYLLRVDRLFTNNRFNLIIILLIAIVIRLPLYHTSYWRTNDAIEYINLARNIASGAGFIQNYKFNYSTTDPVITSSFHGRTSLFSLFLAAILYLGGNEYTMQIFCLGIGVINSCLVYILCRKWASPVWSFTAGLLAALNPNLLINNRLILTEPLFTLFILLVFITFYYMKERYLKYFFMGLFISLAYLTRAEGIFLLPLFLFASVKSPKRLVHSIILIASFIIISTPYFYGNFVNTGNPFYTVHKRLYVIRDYHEYVNGAGYGVTFPTPMKFIESNFFWIINKEIVIFEDNINSLIYFDFFGPLAMFLLLVFFIPSWKKFANFYIFAFLIVLIYTSAWSALTETGRFFTSTFLLLLVPLSYAFEKLAKKSIFFVMLILVCTIIPYLILDIHRIIWARTVETLTAEDVGPIRRSNEFAWINRNINTNDIISSTNPEMIYLFTNHAGIITPNVLNKNNYYTYIHQYHVKFFLTDTSQADKLLDSVADLKKIYPYGRIYKVRK